MASQSNVVDDNGTSIVRSTQAIGQCLTDIEAALGVPPSVETAARRRRKPQPTSFAAAVSPAALQNARALASAPLLGPSSAAAFALGSSPPSPRKPARKRLTLRRAANDGGAKRRSLAKSVRAPLKTVAARLATVASRVPRPGRRAAAAKRALPAPPAPATAHSKDEPSTGSQRSGSPVASDLSDGCQDAAEGGRRRLSFLLQEDSQSPLHVDTRRPLENPQSPLRVDPRLSAEPTSHFRSPSPAASPLASTLASTSNLSTTSSCSEGYRAFLSFVSASRAYDESPPPPDTDDMYEIRRVPSILDSAHVSAHEDGLEVVVTPELLPAAFDTTPAADPFLSSGEHLTALTAPAPQAAVPERHEEREASTHESQIPGPEEAHRCHHSTHPVTVPQDFEGEDDACSIPSIRSVDAHAVVCDQAGNAQVIVCEHSAFFDGGSSAPVPQVGDLLHAAREATSAHEAADSALMWGCVTALLGAPAPKAVRSGGKAPSRSAPVNLWQDEAAGGGMDDIVSLSEDDDPDEAEGGSLPLSSDRDVSMEIQETELLPQVVEPDSGSCDDASDSCSLGALSIDLLELEDGDDNGACSVTAKVGVEEEADSALAWGALGMLLGSSAPKSVPKNKKVSRQAAHLWCSEATEHDCSDMVPSIALDEDDSSSLGVVSIDLHELEDTDDHDACFVIEKVGVEEEADSALAWGALGMLLGSSAPKSIPKNKKVSRQAAPNLWCGEETEHDCSDTVPSIEEEKDDTSSISSVQSKEPLDDGIITDLEEFMLANESNTPLRNVTDGKEAVDSVMAWSALAAFLGAPAPPLIVGKKIKRSNLWADENSTEEELDDLLPFVQYHSSCEDAKAANGENTQQVDVDAQPGCGDISDDDTHSIPSLSASYDSGSSSALSVP